MAPLPSGERLASLEQIAKNQVERCDRTTAAMWQQLEQIHELQRETLTAIAALKVQAGVWGAVAGAVPVAITICVWLVLRALGG